MPATVGTLADAVYDVSTVRWLTVEAQVGRFLAGIFGWDPRPSFEQVLGYIAYLVPIAWMYFRRPDERTGARAQSRGAGVAEAATVGSP